MKNVNHLRNYHRAAFIAAVSLGFGMTVQAASLTVQNASFEDPDLPAGAFTTQIVPGWDAFNGPQNIFPGIYGVFNPTGTAVLPPPTDGEQVAFINILALETVGLEQTLTDTLTAGLTYTLQADFAYADPALVSDVEFALVLMAGSTELASVVGSTPEFSNVIFTTATLTYTATANDLLLGQFLGIRIRNNDSAIRAQIDFDNIRLDASPVPLPLPLVLFGSGLAALAGRRRQLR